MPPPPASRLWQELTAADFAGLDPERTVALLPVAAVEQHGPHLPLGVDVTIGEALVARALELLPPGHETVLLLPTSWAGRSVEHQAFPGTLTLSTETLHRVWLELGASVARAGVRKLVLFNSHGGNVQVMQAAARDLRVAHRVLAVAVTWPQLGMPAGLVDLDERLFGIHAGEIETALMLALRPDLVRTERARDFPALARTSRGEFPALMALGAAGFGWMAQDLNPEGALGNAARARPETGRAILEHVARGLVELLGEVGRFPLANLRDGPLEPGRVG